MKSRSRTLRRRSASIQPRPRILVICEGRVTEPSYLRGLKTQEQVRSIEIEIDDRGRVPKSLVERAAATMRNARKQARAARDQNLIYDEVWCVFDVDEHPNMKEALEQARANRISVALSNPCFELWLLLHFRDHRAFIERHKVQSECRDLIQAFEKAVEFTTIAHLVNEAVERASSLEKWQTERGCMGENPSTTVHNLVMRIKSISKAAGLNEIDSIRN